MNKDNMKEMDKMLDKTLGVITEGESKLELFKGKEIRKVFHDNEWHYSIIDIILAITESNRASKYWNDLKQQIVEKEGFNELSDKIGKLKLKSKDGKYRPTETADVETIFRIIQSIPSPKAEVFKRWLAKVGYERIQEIQNPEIGIKRSMAQYRANGRSDEWIKSRVKGALTRSELTSEWSKRGVKEGVEYATLTDTISKGALNVSTKEHKKIKMLKSQNLRDHMSTLELAIVNLGEAATAEITRETDAQGYQENHDAAKDGGEVAGNARINIEIKTKKPVVTSQNFLGGNNGNLPMPKK